MLCTILLSLGLTGGMQTLEHGGVRVEVTVRAQLYEWTVTNLDAPPVSSFEIDHTTTYPAAVPEGWLVEDEAGHLRTWAESDEFAIDRGENASFGLRTTSVGSVLGLSPLRLRFAGTGDPLVFEEAWAPVPRPRSIPMIVLVTMTAIGLLHAAAAGRRGRRGGG